MKTQKLTAAQTACLTLLNNQAQADFYDLLRVGANGSTTARLVDLQLIQRTASKSGGTTWSITRAGREALLAGRYGIARQPHTRSDE